MEGVLQMDTGGIDMLERNRIYNMDVLEGLRALPDDAEKWEWLEEGDKVCNLQGTGRWYTDLPVERVGEILPYSYNDCQKFDFFDAVNTDDRYSIPDTDGIIGVPIDFLSIYSPEQFEIVGML